MGRGSPIIFKYSEFKKFIKHIKSLGKVVPLSEWDNSKSIILRHDVDFCVEAAYKLSQIEAECGIRSSFFFLINCPTYNPFALSNKQKIREMKNSGFDIGLHFDPTVYGDVNESKLRKFVDMESGILGSITGDPIKSISLHNPSSHGLYPLFEGYCNAYLPTIFSDDCYLSDSRMDFRNKNPYTFAEKVKEFPIQILLHPIHYSEEGYDYPELLSLHLKEYILNIDKSFRMYNSTYAQQLSTNDLFSYIKNK